MSRLVGHELAGDLFCMEKMLSDYAQMVPGLEAAPLIHPWPVVGTGSGWE